MKRLLEPRMDVDGRENANVVPEGSNEVSNAAESCMQACIYRMKPKHTPRRTMPGRRMRTGDGGAI